MPEAESIIPLINNLRQKHFDLVFVCTLQHPLNHAGFAANNPVSLPRQGVCRGRHNGKSVPGLSLIVPVRATVYL